jgi:Domain of unknown function (DUF4357)
LQAATIKLFLVHGSPNGLRTAELSNWSGKAIAAPRTEISDLIKREELTSPGVYFLTGVDPESGERAMYIGEAENVATRLRGHAAKDFWNAATVFVSKDENLTKAHIRYLEGMLIEKANKNESAVIMNSASSGAKLPESDAAEMDVFLQKCLQLLPVLGISDFSEKVDSVSESKDLLYCKIKGLTATGKRTANGFIVFAGSQAVLEHRPSAKRMKAKREELKDKGVLKEKNGYLIFTKDVEFGSPSTAGSVVRGGNTNGLTNWKNSKGVQLKVIEANET